MENIPPIQATKERKENHSFELRPQKHLSDHFDLFVLENLFFHNVIHSQETA
jgi:hypothetical protein